MTAAWHRIPIATLAVLALPASPALAKRIGAAQGKPVAVSAAVLQPSQFDLVRERLGPAAPQAAARALPLGSMGVAIRHRVTSTALPSADFWAGVPDIAVSYRAGKRGPVIELGALGFDMRPLPGGIAVADDSFAHLSLAWNF